MLLVGLQPAAMAELQSSATTAAQQPPMFTFWLAVIVVSIAMVLLSAAVAVWAVGMYRSRHMPNRQAQEALLAARTEFRRVFQTQRESEARLLHSMSGAGFGAWSIDLATGKSWRSPQYDVIFGYSQPPAQWTLRMFLDHVVPEDRESVQATLLNADASANEDTVSVAFECRIRRADGQVRWIEAHGTRESKAQAGSMIFGLVQDITERKNAEAQLKNNRNSLLEKEQRLAEAQQIAKVGSWDCDFATNHLSGSDELCRIFGLAPGEFHGTFESFMEYVHPEDRHSARHVIQSACQSLKPFFFEHRIIQPGGQVRLIEAQGRVMLSNDGVPVGLAGIAHDITERQAAEEHLHRLAHYDSLTGLPNRRLFYESLAKEVEVARDQDWTVALLYLDLDRFKDVNDTFGHLMGDELLRQVAERILSCTRVRDTVGRLGGDEFGLIAVTSEGSDDAATMADKIIEELQQPFVLAGHDVTVTPSIGIALCPEDSGDTETLIKFADMAMYHAKAAGRNAYRFYTPVMNARAREKVQLETALRKAVERGEFVLHYQPEIDTESGEWIGAEALLRWNRPRHGLVLPGEFVPALEESGLIVPVGRWIIDRACRQLAEWRAEGIGGISVSVNVSAKQVKPVGLRRDADDNNEPAGHFYETEAICDHVARCLDLYDVAPGSLKLELTETALMSHAENTIELLGKLKKLGIQILVDDFGTGYSSLAYLKRFPIDTLKIDREFINDLPTDSEDRAITRAIISLAHSLNLKVIAEGVETREQLDFLQDEHCDQAQGFYIAHPMPPSELLKLFQAKTHGHERDFDGRQSSLFSRGDSTASRALH
jgi:diguanylate cyclase (GGDEF)-like protein/PAS domain S-box-containing protein